MRWPIVRGILLVSAALLSGFPTLQATAQQPTLEDKLLDALIGKWVLTGTIGKTSTTHDVDARWVLNHQFVQLHEVSREKLPADPTKPQYEAIVLIGWDVEKKQYVVHWIDVFGGGFSLRGSAEKTPSSIPIVFKSDTGNFYTTFDYDEKTKSWRWSMDNETNGKRQEFARLTMRR